MTIQELARKYADSFETATRKDDTNFIRLKTEDENIKNLIYDAHNGMLPDDYKYQFIHEALEALEAIAECSDPDDIQLESDVYNSDLLKWVSSHLNRSSYVDETVKNWEYTSFFQVLAGAQYEEKREVLSLVRFSLEKILEQ